MATVRREVTTSGSVQPMTTVGLDLATAWVKMPERICPNCGESDPYRYHVEEDYEEVTVYACKRKKAE